MRRLALQREHLAELPNADLALVVGGAVTTPPGVCVGDVLTSTQPLVSRVVECDSLYNPCVTSTCEQ